MTANHVLAIAALVYFALPVPAVMADEELSYFNNLWKAAGDDVRKAEEIINNDCKKIDTFASKGAKLYKNKQYAAARNEFKTQLILMEYCDGNFDKERFTQHQYAVAYNNVAMTYVHERNFLRARAWASLVPDDPGSRFNLEKIRPELEAIPERISGAYEQYVGQGLWAVMHVSHDGNEVSVEAQFLRAGPRALFFGPNMGDFAASAPLKGKTAFFRVAPMDDGNVTCEISIRFDKNSAFVETIKGGDSECGFGGGVYAGGEFYRVSD